MRGVGEVGARVLQRLAVEPQLVEVVADVVVVVDVALRLREVRRQGPPAREQLAECRVLGGIAIRFLEQGQKVAADLEAARAVEIAEVQVGVHDQHPQRLAVEDPQYAPCPRAA